MGVGGGGRGRWEIDGMVGGRGEGEIWRIVNGMRFSVRRMPGLVY